MAIIQVDQTNIEQEHICCAITEKKGEQCVSQKKSWMKEQFEHGLVFKKLDERGKVFIEYIPAKEAWCSIDAPNYMHINCFWVSGKFKGQGYANELLEHCLKDARDKKMDGLTILSSAKKMPFLCDPKYLKYKGFQTADTASPFYELLYYPLSEGAAVPRFKPCCKEGKTDEIGMVLYYSNQCPYSDKQAQVIKEIAEERGSTVKLKRFETKEQARNAPAPFTSYSFFHNGNLVGNEIFSDKKFIKFMENM